MISKVDIPVTVELMSDHRTRKTIPKSVWWDGKLYPIFRVGLHHTYRQGRTLYHVFSVVGQSVFFRLILDTDTLSWRLSEISDGLPN